MKRCWMLLTGACVLFAAFIGCGSSSTDPNADFANELGEFDIIDGTGQTETAGAASPATRMGLQLKVGDRFPLIKTVQQSLVNNDSDGAAPSHSVLELMLALQVEQVLQDRLLMSVRYHRVRYQHSIAGEQVAYDSQQPAESVPEPVQPYRGLINNGFSFWLGMKNEILEVVDFDGFAERCIRSVAPQYREPLLAEIRKSLGENGADGIVSFIDDSIGLLPYGDETDGGVVEVGSRWQRSRTISRPQPVTMNLTCTLTSINDSQAEVDIIEKIDGSQVELQPANASDRVEIRGGHAIGRCTIDRKSGMPVHSQFERFLDLLVHTADGRQIGQKKYVLTTIRTFPEQAPPTQPVAGQPGPARPAAQQAAAIQQAGGVPPTQSGQRGQAVQQAGGTISSPGGVIPALQQAPEADYGSAPTAKY